MKKLFIIFTSFHSPESVIFNKELIIQIIIDYSNNNYIILIISIYSTQKDRQIYLLV